MIRMGINLIPRMPVVEIVETIQAAEELGFEICLLADEGFMRDVYVTLSAAAQKTSRIMLGPVTNGYTRHPAVTAVGLATLNEVSNGRALVTLVAGGSVVLGPMDIPLKAPLTVMRDSIEIMRKLWSGETISYAGKRFNLREAKMSLPKQDIPLWMAVRGPKMLSLAGEVADGVVLMGKSDLESAFGIVRESEESVGRKIERIFLERIVYTPQMLEESVAFFGHVVMDMPERLRNSFLTMDEMRAMDAAFADGGAQAVSSLLTPEIIKRFKVAGTIPECTQTMQGIIKDHQLDIFLLNITGSGLKANIQTMQDTLAIMSAAGSN
jgi:5,10-methylenetetrahydromethanopterin reductase